MRIATVKNNDNMKCRDAEKLNGSYIAGKEIKWYSHSKKIWSVPFKTKHALTNKPAFVLVGTYLRERKIYFHIIIIEKLETTQIIFNKWVVKQSAVCQKKKKNRIFLSTKTEQITDPCNNLDKPQRNYSKWKEPITKGHTLNDFTYVTFLK